MLELRPGLAAKRRFNHVGRRALAALAVAALLAGCGGGSPAPETTGGKSPTAGTGPVAKPAPPIAPKEPPPGPPLPAVTYEPQGRRDPFVAVSIAREGGGAQKANVVTLRLATD